MQETVGKLFTFAFAEPQPAAVRERSTLQNAGPCVAT